MKNKKIVFGTILFLFTIASFCGVSNAFYGELTLSPLQIKGYNLGNLNEGDIIKLDSIDSSGIINVYIMNEEQWNNIGGIAFDYLIRWKDISYLSYISFDILSDDNYYVVFYNKDIFVSRTVYVFISVEYASISITSPDISSIYVFESGYNYISWTSTGKFDYVIIDLYKGGFFLETIRSGINNDGEYSWYIYNDEYTDGSDYQIKIRDYYDANTYDYSSYFTIDCEIEKTITVTSPTSVSTFVSGDSLIRWTSTGDISYVKIDLYKDNVYIETISTHEYNDNLYIWDKEDDKYIDGSYYQIKISDYNDNTIYDYSDYFTIKTQGYSYTRPTPSYPLINTAVFSMIVMAIIALVVIIFIRKHKRKITKEVIVIQKEILKTTYCKECGAKFLDSTKVFCSKCGTKN